MKKPLSIHIFRRDLRLQDNTALISALENSQSVIPLFIFDKEYEQKNCFQLKFLYNTLKELNEELNKRNSKLHIINKSDIFTFIEDIKPDAIYMNRLYAPENLEFEKEILKRHEFTYLYHDYLLNPPDSIFNLMSNPYTIFTPYYKKSSQIDVDHPLNNDYSNFKSINSKYLISIEDITKDIDLSFESKNIALKGGRKEAFEIMENFSYNNYDNLRDIPYENTTSHLSTHNHFGTISIREVYYHGEKFKAEIFIRQLYWRDFFYQIGFNFPHIFEKPFQLKYEKIEWENDEDKFKKWCEGNTGFPIVDAGMRELNTTGYMHNRVRMIVSSFLVKDLHIDWRWGEKYFEEKLIDFDRSVNNGSWQWAASTGCDTQPYFRIFNPWRQQIRFDKDCLYIKKWIQELKDLPPKTIHNLEKQRPLTLTNSYPTPIVNHNEEKDKAFAKFKSI